jgi:lysozyme family protein
MTPEFIKAYAITLSHEGLYANHPNDKGGETFKGIARKFHPKWKGWVIIDEYKTKPNFPQNLFKVSEAMDELTRRFYYEEFWLKMKLDKIGYQPILNELFDTGVNMGPGTAISDLQRSLNILNRNQKDYPDLKVDGQIGSVTIGCVNNHHYKKRIFNALNSYQAKRYIEICEKDKSQEVFFAGWLGRIELMQ